jgi:hypothetical protein
MSTIGPKRTSATAVHMSTFGGRADMGKLYSTHCAPHRSLIFRADLFGQSAVI